jgi:hypothetical protein
MRESEVAGPLPLQSESGGGEVVPSAYQDELQKLSDITRALEARRRLRGMQYYTPNIKQSHGHQSLARIILYCGGNRAGKSTFGAMEICYAMTKKYPDWYPMKKRFYGPTRGVVSATSFGVVMRVIEPKLTQLLPQGEYTVKRTAQGFPSQYKFKDGSILDVLTLEMDLMAYQGADWDIAWMDEPQNKTKFLGIQRGLVDRRGRLLITFTPLTEPWMKEELADRSDGVNIDLIQADIRDNMSTIGGSPILSEQSIKEFEANMPEDFKETMIHGKFFHLRGAVYQEFSDEHIKTFEYDTRSPVICVLDPHDRVPHHIIWAWIDRDDDVYVDYEWEGHVELDDMARIILDIEKKRGYNMKKRLIDPNFGRKPAKVGTNLTVMKELARNGAGFYEANDNIELGHMMVRDYLHYDRKKPVSATNKPKLFFSRERAPKTIRSMRNLQYEDWSGKTSVEKDPKEVEKDKENHGADCIRYLIIGRPKYQVQTPEPELTESPY